MLEVLRFSIIHQPLIYLESQFNTPAFLSILVIFFNLSETEKERELEYSQARYDSQDAKLTEDL